MLFMKLSNFLIGILIIALFLGGFFYFRAHNSLRSSCANISNPSECWDNQIKKGLEADGVEGAFKKISEFYNEYPNFSGACHSIMHTIGDKGYQDFKIGKPVLYSPKMNSCSFGFFHGFMEALLAESHELKEATDFCIGQSVSDKTWIPRDECFHGIGHGITDNHTPDEWKNVHMIIERSTTLCRSIRYTEKDFSKCLGGVYNAVANAYREGNYGLVIDSADPLKLCKFVKKDNYKQDCYNYMARVLLKIPPFGFESAIHLAGVYSPSEYIINTIGGVSIMISHNNLPDEEVIDVCKKLQDNFKNVCIRAYAIGLVQVGEAGAEHKKALTFCTKIPGEPEQKICFKGVISELSKYWYWQENKRLDNVCKLVEKKSRHSCGLALIELK